MDELKITDIQIKLSILSIIAAGVSIVLLINNKYKIINNRGFIGDSNAYKINLYNRILLFIVFTSFLIINYNSYINAKNNGKDISSFKLQLYSSILITIATLISLYVAYKFQGNADLENPDI